jgi:hypothetical protein
MTLLLLWKALVHCDACQSGGGRDGYPLLFGCRKRPIASPSLESYSFDVDHKPDLAFFELGHVGLELKL